MSNQQINIPFWNDFMTRCKERRLVHETITCTVSIACISSRSRRPHWSLFWTVVLLLSLHMRTTFLLSWHKDFLCKLLVVARSLETEGDSGGYSVVFTRFLPATRQLVRCYNLSMVTWEKRHMTTSPLHYTALYGWLEFLDQVALFMRQLQLNVFFLQDRGGPTAC